MKSLQLDVGNWVKATTKKGAFLHGYIKKINDTAGTVDVHVLQSDQKAMVGQTVTLLKGVVKNLAMSKFNESEIRSLIDLALTTRDKEWFDELTMKLENELKKSKGKSSNPIGTRTINSIRR
ncbi:IDEAL domain-containing protein [Terrilactibacillus sp. BCM23-1]|uniref:IDEAL domain-containing protein n=1 Tax=Terrilactibacillus tamarindi TaxID=2599694 RepID=A0A6N8CSP2_9BACI|nr:IDEAL domain-containing protein [Terrilactibacillus tamarindi]MTT33209.1 IDEAL domain-containing protein [Terrilactibacillus tamarindi]